MVDLNKIDEINLKDFPEHKIGNRVKLSYNWITGKVGTLLDGGCSYAYGTRYFAEKSEKTYAIDVNPIHIKVAQIRYPHINFKVSMLEDTGFENEMFDFIVLNDVLEHTNDKIQTLREMYRILRKNGEIIISTPHKGLFAFLDPYNYGYNLKKYFPWLYKSLYKLIRLVKEGKIPEDFNPEHEQKHWHYSLKDLRKMLDSTEFKDNYKIERVFRSGLILEVLVMNLESILNIIIPQRISQIVLKPLSILANIDYWIPLGVLSYNIAIKLRKNN